ncbi:MAG TPA: hypothetical protein VML95_06205 [Longimicrobiales bacterium]|nr:hypothetical protein [Longimicrobiales bacterium]
MRNALVVAFFVAYAMAVTYPGVLPFNRAYPLIAGLPFVLAWYAGWVVLAGVVLFLYHSLPDGD